MFLLIQNTKTRYRGYRIVFTFHDVSINTANCCLYACREICFTFHDVSINTASLLIIEGSKHALHSTMFLLILDGNIIHDLNITFTFHDVSINTKIAQMPVNTVFSLHSTMFLLIHRNNFLCL